MYHIPAAWKCDDNRVCVDIKPVFLPPSNCDDAHCTRKTGGDFS